MDTYEKKYNEALERAKTIIDGKDGWNFADHIEIDPVIKEIFPELRESEDERIRKALIDALKVSETIGELKFRLPYPTREECIAYLEKQKEHHIPWYDYQKSKEAGYTIVPNEEYEQLIKQKEQKPEDKEITLTNFEEVLNTFLFDFANSPIEDCEPKEYTKKHSAEILKAAYAELNAQLKQDIFEAQQEGRREGYEAAKAEQKPAEWSEKDEDRIRQIERIAQQAGCTQKLQEEIHDWLNSLRPQPKPEVTDEEIEEMVTKRARSTGTTKSEIGFYRNGVKEAIKRFGLRPSWKPSEEQMAGLETAISTMRFQLNVGDKRLNSLYEQLKKLM